MIIDVNVALGLIGSVLVGNTSLIIYCLKSIKKNGDVLTEKEHGLIDDKFRAEVTLDLKEYIDRKLDSHIEIISRRLDEIKNLVLR